MGDHSRRPSRQAAHHKKGFLVRTRDAPLAYRLPAFQVVGETAAGLDPGASATRLGWGVRYFVFVVFLLRVNSLITA